jgi:uncharacterized protein YndB with AHSA1/START domain
VARFTATREVAAPAELVWARITDWEAHGRWFPLTSMTVTRDTGGVGTTFVGRTGPRAAAFDDPMEVVRWEPASSTRAGTAGIVHRGSIVLGTAELQVVPLPGGRSRVRWTEDISFVSRGASRAVTLPLVVGGRVTFGYLLSRMAREVEAESSGA